MSIRGCLSGMVLVLMTVGCVSSGYIPQHRQNYATSILRFSLYLHILAPRIRAISLRPPFACDAETLRLADEGFVVPEDITELERFPEYGGAMYGGPFAVRTVAGPDLDPGPWLYVLTGENKDDPATSIVNIVNRYNDVAKCLEARP